MTTAEFWNATAVTSEDPLRGELIKMIRERNDATPRHLQRELGPSEVGHPCMRKMAYAMLEIPRCNPEYDPLPSIIGTATHHWLDSAARYANNVLGRTRWLTEIRVNVAPGLSGSCDLFDTDTGTVIDWKVLGNTNFEKYQVEPPIHYKRQVQLYGQGFLNAGHAVNHVAIAMLPRGKTLHSMRLWKVPYDQAAVDETLTQRDTVIGLLDDLRPDVYPERFHWFPATPHDCAWCPFFKPDPKNWLQCPGTGV